VIEAAGADDDLRGACSAAPTEGAIDAIRAVQAAVRSSLHAIRSLSSKADASDGLLIFTVLSRFADPREQGDETSLRWVNLLYPGSP
jgi:hypothetical protein